MTPQAVYNAHIRYPGQRLVCPEIPGVKDEAAQSDNCTNKIIEVNPGKPFRILITKRHGTEQTSDVEIKAWVNDRPTEAIASLRTVTAPQRLNHRQVEIGHEIVKSGQGMFAVPLEIDQEIGNHGMTITVHLTKGKFRKVQEPPHPSIVNDTDQGKHDLAKAKKVVPRQVRYALTVKGGIRPAPFRTFVLKLYTRDQLVKMGLVAADAFEISGEKLSVGAMKSDQTGGESHPSGVSAVSNTTAEHPPAKPDSPPCGIATGQESEPAQISTCRMSPESNKDDKYPEMTATPPRKTEFMSLEPLSPDILDHDKDLDEFYNPSQTPETNEPSQIGTIGLRSQYAMGQAKSQYSDATPSQGKFLYIPYVPSSFNPLIDSIDSQTAEVAGPAFSQQSIAPASSMGWSQSQGTQQRLVTMSDDEDDFQGY